MLSPFLFIRWWKVGSDGRVYICLARRKDKGLSTRNASCDYSSVLQSMTQEYDAAVVWLW